MLDKVVSTRTHWWKAAVLRHNTAIPIDLPPSGLNCRSKPIWTLLGVTERGRTVLTGDLPASLVVSMVRGLLGRDRYKRTVTRSERAIVPSRRRAISKSRQAIENVLFMSA